MSTIYSQEGAMKYESYKKGLNCNADVCDGRCTHMCAYTVKAQGQPQMSFLGWFSSFETGSLTKLKLFILVRLEASKILCFLPP